MTHPTKAIYKMLLTDYVKVSNIAIEEMLYDEQDLVNSMKKIEAINYHQEVEHNGIKFWCYNAGHVLGAAMFMVDKTNIKLMII
jgi:cleavage and polyadenylation specificity factor subunit 3